MSEIKCVCGHTNPYGTILCEKCGRLLDESKKGEKLADMRYEGAARRSQTYNKSIIDKVWNFFSSVKIGVTLIVLVLAASAIGTILPQEMYIPKTVTPAEHYEDTYGWFGKVYYLLGFHNLYSSWWYLVLIALLGMSLVIASIDRVVPLHRSLTRQKVQRHTDFLKRQRVFGVTENAAVNLDSLKERLVKQRYKVREENGSLLAEKGRFSRWGPYVNHLGLIIFLIGGMLRFVPGMYVDETMWLREGETKEVPGTNGEYFLKNDKFTLEVYDKENQDDKEYSAAIDKEGSVAKNYQSDVTLYRKDGDTLPGEEPKLKKVKDYSIKVNHPLKQDHLAMYQVDYKLDELASMSFNLINKKTQEEFGSLTIDLSDPEKTYKLKNGYSVEIMSYFPDFEFDDEGQPTTKSKVPNNPAFIFNLISPEVPDGEVSFVAIKQTLEPLGENTYKMAFTGIDTRNAAGLTIRKDLTLWILFLGGGIFMIGVVQGMYWNHRRIWIQKRGNEIWVAGHTNKNWHSLKRDIQAVIKDTGIEEPADQTETQSSNKGETISG